MDLEHWGTDTSGTPGNEDGYHMAAMPAPDSPPLAVQLSSTPILSVRLPPSVPSFDKHCTPSRAPVANLGQYAHLSYDQMRERRKQRGYIRKDSKAEMKTHLAVVGAEESMILIPRRQFWAKGGNRPWAWLSI